ncbi:MAG: FkbM family methyltransferase [Nitratireductor sp.]|nr:FkbM family methyltransferase [Nitratireductor sp.]
MSDLVPVSRSILQEKYEEAEARLVSRYIPADRPVVELGASLGVISTLIRSRLDDGVPMVSVEALPHLVEIVRANVARYDASDATIVLHRAVAYDCRTVSFSTDANLLANRIANAASPDTIEVTAISLAEIVEILENQTGMTLVCDVEGAEWAIFEHDRKALEHFDIAVVEVHPEIFSENGHTAEQFETMVEAAGFEIVDRDKQVLMLARTPG